MLKFGLGLGVFIVMVSIVMGILLQISDHRGGVGGRQVGLFIVGSLVLVVTMRFCGVFSSLRLFMLPRKRSGDVTIVEEDGDTNTSTGNSSSLKKHRISCCVSATAESTVKKNYDKKSNSSDNGSSSLAQEEQEDSLAMALGNSNHTDIDEDLHSRQLAVYGRETMRRLFASNVLVSGMQGLGAEIGMDLVNPSDFFIFFIL